MPSKPASSIDIIDQIQRHVLSKAFQAFVIGSICPASSLIHFCSKARSAWSSGRCDTKESSFCCESVALKLLMLLVFFQCNSQPTVVNTWKDWKEEGLKMRIRSNNTKMVWCNEQLLLNLKRNEFSDKRSSWIFFQKIITAFDCTWKPIFVEILKEFFRKVVFGCYQPKNCFWKIQEIIYVYHHSFMQLYHCIKTCYFVFSIQVQNKKIMLRCFCTFKVVIVV